jgi:two-component system, chemotaxis family, CheB/CheR fusion protein
MVDMSADDSSEPEAKEVHAEASAARGVSSPERRRAEEPQPESTQRFPIIAIGASAGGLEAIEHLVAHLEPCGAAFLIMQHLSPRYVSSLPEILARSASLPVVAMQEGHVVARDVIYIAPPGVEVRMEGGALHLRPLRDLARQHPIDILFRTLARDRGASAIAVVLSGAGTDGSLGIRSIKEEGGITFVQDPASAGQPSMPQSALDSGCVDFSLHPAAIGHELTRIGAYPHALHRRPGRPLHQDLLDKLFEQLRRVSGVDFSAYKLTTVERRIERRMALKQLERASDYVKLVQENRAELNLLYDDLLIGVTGFFRDQEPFELLKNQVFPPLFERRDAQLPVRVWVPGCATGEEVYSILICMLEYVDVNLPGQRLQVFATDIDEQALARARQGIYPQGIELDVSAERLQRFFTRTEKGYQISRKLRDMVVFARHNLGKDPPFSRLDLISCRNVLIYLQPELQKRIMRVFHYALNTRGCLLLGTAESVGEASDLFSLVERKLKLYVKKHGSSPGVFDFAFGKRHENSAAAMSVPPVERKAEISIHQLADRKILERYGPPGVLIDEGMNILQFRGQTAPYLAPSPGAATLGILRMVRPELLIQLKGALQRVLHEGVQVSCEPVRVSEPSARQVVIDVIPLDPTARPGCLLVLFRELLPEIADDVSGAAPNATATSSASDPRHVQELERELITTREYLETIIQELATSNEELQSSNEELQSSNEELQSSNEELETSKEELQAANEELVTVNEELHTRITQFGIASDDLVNVLINVTSPVLLVGLDLRIRRFSAAAERLLNLLPSDIGRPISYLGTALKVPQIEGTISESMKSMRFKELRVRCSNGSWYMMHTAPYQTAERVIRGVVIELIPVAPPQSAEQGPELDELVGKVLATLPNEVVVLDQSLRMVWMNHSFQGAWGASSDLFGHPLELLLPRTEKLEQLWSAVEDAVFTGRPFEALLTSNTEGDGEPARRWSARCLPAELGRGALTMLLAERAS